ncbi:MAG: hypothetical protein M0D57_20000 [Sphingobacteriales bacterium JAD_PAG50586_3]|nr:MAG: hypothetical protein M0D57_20000 [Sphingobacteriales bacterium JAD_PAG50586_3]
MKKIITVSLFLFISAALFAQRQTLAKCYLSLEPPAGWIKKEKTDTISGEYTCTFLGDTVSLQPALAFFPR